MWDLQRVRELVSVLMECSSYFRLSLKERHLLVREALKPAQEPQPLAK